MAFNVDAIDIRNARINDLAAIVEIYNSTISDRLATADTQPITVESRISWLKNRNFTYRPIWVAQTATEVAAWLSFNDFYGRPAYQHTAEISLYVKQNFRRQGIGSLLLKNAIAKSTELQIETLLGFIFAHNQPSINLFKKYGFQSWGLLPKIAQLDNQEKDLAILGLRVSC